MLKQLKENIRGKHGKSEGPPMTSWSSQCNQTVAMGQVGLDFGVSHRKCFVVVEFVFIFHAFWSNYDTSSPKMPQFFWVSQSSSFTSSEGAGEVVIIWPLGCSVFHFFAGQSVHSMVALCPLSTCIVVSEHMSCHVSFQQICYGSERGLLSSHLRRSFQTNGRFLPVEKKTKHHGTVVCPVWPRVPGRPSSPDAPLPRFEIFADEDRSVD